MTDFPKPEARTTRRAFLTRDLKAICALAAGPLLAEMLPTQALARDRGSDWGSGGEHSWGGWGSWRGGHHRGGGGHHGGGHHGDGHHGGGHSGGGAGGGHGNLCFLRGTRIMTATGERAIEELAAGDVLPTVFGGLRPVQWIGSFRRYRAKPDAAWPAAARPVRIAKSALGPDIPKRDLYVTQGHALLFDGLLVPAGTLVNGATITIDPASEKEVLEFFHVKLASHNVIYAEGAPCETLLNVNKTMSNFSSYLDAFGDSHTTQPHCAPIICNGPRRELATRARSLMSPWLGPQQFDQIRTTLELRARALA
uniref:Hint domain-containing protein n=1 Tax=Bradyrhizobium sp. (strain ORS 278) TaxID=114615 RepID=UPI0026972F17